MSKILYFWVLAVSALLPLWHLRILFESTSLGVMAILNVITGFMFFCCFIRQQPLRQRLYANLKRFWVVWCAVGILLVSLLVKAFLTHTMHAYGIVLEWFLLPLAGGGSLFFLWHYYHPPYRVSFLFLLALASLQLSLTGFILEDIKTFDGRLTGLYDSPNMLGMRLGLLILLCVLFFHRKSTMSYIIPFLGCVALWMTESAAAVGALWIGILLYVSMLGLREMTSISFVKKVVIILGLCLVLSVTAMFAQQKLNSAYAESGRTPLDSRIMIWRVAFDMVRVDPLGGIDVGSFQAKYLEMQQYYNPYLEWAVPHPHSMYLFLWLYGGWFAFVALIYLLAFGFYRSVVMQSAAGPRWAAVLGYLFVVGLVDVILPL